MGPMSEWNPTEAIELIMSNIKDIAFGSVNTIHKYMSSLDVMQNIDWTTMFIFFLIFFGLLVYSMANILIIVKKKRQQIIDESNSSGDNTTHKDSVQTADHKSSVSQLFSDNRPSKLSAAKGPDKCCVDWVDRIVKWFYAQNDATIDSLLKVWINALNNQNQKINNKLSNDTAFIIEFVELCREQTSAPEVSDIYVNKESNENIITQCKTSVRGIKFHIKALKDSGSVNEESFHYELVIDRFEAMLKTICISEDQLLVIKLMERPDFKANLKPVKNPETQQMRSDNRISEDAIITAIVNRITTTCVDLSLSQYKDFPRLERSDTQKISPNSEAIERKLFVKVVQAKGLANNKDSHDPYCVVEVDEPNQRFQTLAIKDTNDPVWNEHFIFNLKEESTEILFELYDKTNDKFLGLGIVSVDELKSNPSQNQVLTLQPRPLETEQITGSLGVEFLFMEHHSDPGSDNKSDSNLKSVEQTITKSNGISLKNSNKDMPLIVNTDADEELIRNDAIRTELEVIEEQNYMYDSLPHVCPESYVSSLTNQTQDTGFGQNPFIEIKNNPFIDSSYQLLSNKKNPFSGDNINVKFDRSVSFDNLSLVIPVIPPLIDFSTKPPQNSVPNLEDKYLLSEEFKGNPFNILKFYRKHFYTVPTYKIGRHLSQTFEVNTISDHISLPPTTLFPENKDLSELSFLRTHSQNSLNTNPFVKTDRRLISSSFSIDSMIGIESCDENSDENSDKNSDKNSDENSDNTITIFNTEFNRNIDPIDENQLNSEINNQNNDKKNYFRKNKSGSKKMPQIFLNKISFKQKKKTNKDMNENNYINRCNVENSKIGKGMELHDSIINNTSVNENEIDFCLTPDSTEVISSRKSLNVQSNKRSSENGGSEGYSTGRGTPDNPSLKDESQVSSVSSSKDVVGRSRSKEPRSLMKALRKRFSFSKNRSKSAEIRTNKDCETPSRDSSVSSTSSKAKSMPGSREPSSPKDMSRGLTPVRITKNNTESYSNISEISGYSTKTFVHEKSTLIVETNENGLKHYIIPMSLAHKSKWRRKGLKLHSYNDHLFVAKHLSGSITCQVCAKLFSRRPGKQGYQCRDCNYMCHKRCHIQVEVRCTKSTLSSLSLEYVVDPKASQSNKNCSIEVNDQPVPES